jgi:hypothetical protein
VEKWQKNYHSKLDFLELELTRRGLPWTVDRHDIFWAHDQRNEQYHGGTGGVPGRLAIDTIRAAALWVFGVLFNVVDVGKAIEEELAALSPPGKPERQDVFDKVIDNEHGIVEIGENMYYASEVLHAVDQDAYASIGAKLSGGRKGGAKR